VVELEIAVEVVQEAESRVVEGMEQKQQVPVHAILLFELVEAQEEDLVWIQYFVGLSMLGWREVRSEEVEVRLSSSFLPPWLLWPYVGLCTVLRNRRSPQVGRV
jgi:hypothetical protein